MKHTLKLVSILMIFTALACGKKSQNDKLTVLSGNNNGTTGPSAMDQFTYPQDRTKNPYPPFLISAFNFKRIAVSSTGTKLLYAQMRFFWLPRKPGKPTSTDAPIIMSPATAASTSNTIQQPPTLGAAGPRNNRYFHFFYSEYVTCKDGPLGKSDRNFPILPIYHAEGVANLNKSGFTLDKLGEIFATNTPISAPVKGPARSISQAIIQLSADVPTAKDPFLTKQVALTKRAPPAENLDTLLALAAAAPKDEASAVADLDKSSVCLQAGGDVDTSKPIDPFGGATSLLSNPFLDQTESADASERAPFDLVPAGEIESVPRG